MANACAIYALIDPRDSAIRYIGKSLSPQGRFGVHLRERGDTRKCRWVAALRAAGAAPRLVVLEVVEGDGWQAAERRWIAAAMADGADLCNHTSGGEGLHSPSQETRSKLGAIQRARWADPAYRAKVFTPERAAKISAALKGRPKTAEHVSRLPQNQQGYVTPPDRAAKLRAILAAHGYSHPKGQPMHPNARAALAAARLNNRGTKGRAMPAVEREARSVALRGRAKTAEHRGKIRQAALRRWAKAREEAASVVSV